MLKSKNRSPLKSTRLAQRKRKIFIYKATFFVILFLIALSSFFWLFHLPALRLSTVGINGNSAVNTPDVQKIVAEDTAGSYWFIIPKNNRFFYPKSKIKADVLEAFPRFKTVDIKASNQTLELTVVERQPSYVWCKGTPERYDDSDCFFIDAHGYIFSNAAIITGNAFFHFYGLVSTSSPVDTYYMKTESFISVDKLITSLNTLGLDSYALLSEDSGTNTLYLKKGGKVLFQANTTYADLIVNIGILLKQTKIFTQGQNLEYVDLRYGNKIYYKLIGDKAATEQTQ